MTTHILVSSTCGTPIPLVLMCDRSTDMVIAVVLVTSGSYGCSGVDRWTNDAAISDAGDESVWLLLFMTSDFCTASPCESCRYCKYRAREGATQAKSSRTGEDRTGEFTCVKSFVFTASVSSNEGLGESIRLSSHCCRMLVRCDSRQLLQEILEKYLSCAARICIKKPEAEMHG